MIRFLLWAFFAYIVWKLIEAFMTPKNPTRKSDRTSASSSDFSNIEDADYEDVTPKTPPEKKAS